MALKQYSPHADTTEMTVSGNRHCVICLRVSIGKQHTTFHIWLSKLNADFRVMPSDLTGSNHSADDRTDYKCKRQFIADSHNSLLHSNIPIAAYTNGKKWKYNSPKVILCISDTNHRSNTTRFWNIIHSYHTACTVEAPKDFAVIMSFLFLKNADFVKTPGLCHSQYEDFCCNISAYFHVIQLWVCCKQWGVNMTDTFVRNN